MCPLGLSFHGFHSMGRLMNELLVAAAEARLLEELTRRVLDQMLYIS